MAASTPNLAVRGRIELAIRLLSPVLDLMIVAGDRISRLVEPEDPSYITARMPYEGESAPRGLRDHEPRSEARRG